MWPFNRKKQQEITPGRAVFNILLHEVKTKPQNFSLYVGGPELLHEPSKFMVYPEYIKDDSRAEVFKGRECFELIKIWRESPASAVKALNKLLSIVEKENTDNG